MQVDYQSLDGLYQSTSITQGCGPYEPSIASSASSSQASIFSDPLSLQSSIASSISDDFRCNQEDARDRAYAHTQLQQKAALEGCNTADDDAKFMEMLRGGGPLPPMASLLQPPSYADVTSVPRQQRQHPRRCPLSRGQRPPTLQRQQDRKVNFVDNLVGKSCAHADNDDECLLRFWPLEDSATQMVEVLWPLSMTPCRPETGCEKGVLPLRSYIEETLRRSQTSYSTLQVALYYLVLIKPHVPKGDFTKEQRMDCPATRALMCGRRMFLAALILASKYLQDRNYSAKAWSKMSGLKVCEINFNERTFLRKVNWKLHIPDTVFKKWSDIVLDYTPNTQPPPPDQSQSVSPSSWKAVIPKLTPELDQIPAAENKPRRMIPCIGNYGAPSPSTPTPTKSAFASFHADSTSHESTPTPSTVIPRFLEPKLQMEPPALPKMGPLPTPQLTPSSVASGTPAVSACGSRRFSIAAILDANLIRCVMDKYPHRSTYPPLLRRPSMASMASVFSSPESMISDRSRSSRASSISSVSTVSTTSSLAPGRACLAREATCRNARLPIPTAPICEEKELEGSVTKPIIINDGEDVEIVSSPDMADFSISEKVLSHRQDKHTKHAPLPIPTLVGDKGRKRCRTSVRGNRRSNLQEEVRQMLEEAEDAMDIDMDLDDDDSEYISPSPAAEYASKMLSRSNSVICTKENQPPASLERSGSYRKPVQRFGGEKRTCCSVSISASAMSISPVPLYGEVA